MSDTFNMMVAGLTGQGDVLITRVLATALLAEGKNVLTTDYPPSTQRLSGIHSHIRWGSGKLYADVVPEGEADLLVGLEPLECLRIGMRFAAKTCTVIMNEREVPRMIVTPEVRTSGKWKHPSTTDILAYFQRMGINKVSSFDATEVAMSKGGGIITMSMVMLGAAYATGLIPLKKEAVESCIIAFAPKKWTEANLNSFKAGVNKYKDLVRS